MVNIMLHHEGKLSFACGDYMGGQVTQLGELNSDFISVTHLHKLLREDLGYKNFEVERGGQGSEGEGGAQGRREREGNGQERENERGREGDGNGQGREDGEVVAGKGEMVPREEGNKRAIGKREKMRKDVRVMEMVKGGKKREESDGEDDDSEDEHLSNFFETDYDELGLFGNFVSVDGEAVEDELSGLDGHVDEASDHMDDQNHDVGATATAHEDVHGESSTTHEARVPQNPYKNKNDNRVLVLCHNARSCHKLANPNQPTNPKKPTNKKNKDTQRNDAEAGPSTRNKSNAGTKKKKQSKKNKNTIGERCRGWAFNKKQVKCWNYPSKKNKNDNRRNDAEAVPSTKNKSNAGTTKKKPSKKNKNDNRVLVLCHNARSCHKPANPNPPTNPKKPSNKKNKDTQRNDAEAVPSIRNKSNAGTTKKKPSKKNKNDNRGGDTEAGPSIRSKSEARATKKMPGKGPKRKGASNDIGWNENKDIAKHSEQNFKQWLHENSLFDHQRKKLNPQFLQILRDVLRGIGYLHQVENRCHGNLSELNIVIVNGRGKITRMLKDVSKKYVNDYLSLAAIVRSCFCSQRQTIPTELELLLKYISKTKPNRLLNIEHHPIFLSPLQRLSYRVIAYTFLYFGEKKKSFQLKLNEKLPKYNWKLKVRTFSMVLNRGKSFKSLPEKQMKSLQYHKSATSFMRFGRNIVVHLADIDLGGKKLTAEEVDEELNGYWPEFMPILHQDSQVKPLGYFHENGSETDRFCFWSVQVKSLTCFALFVKDPFPLISVGLSLA
ncbi:hypothetical protein CJ030_MR4G029269 [Morella rubra]|uniref:PB1-like domain-containing protein n=1 Tax=Morella rubra TaxID=262757 RepID=A0A6A1WZT6_9ROSI|nr:hypothetical protein CJ030_MR4G029269 [Morella rubra]